MKVFRACPLVPQRIPIRNANHPAIAPASAVVERRDAIQHIHMKTPPLDKVVSIIVGFGIPGLVLLVAVITAGVAGGAAIVVALATLGGPIGMLGGIALLGVLLLISKALTEYGTEVLLRRVIVGLKQKGHSRPDIMKAIDSYPISKSLKAKLREYVEQHY